MVDEGNLGPKGQGADGGPGGGGGRNGGAGNGAGADGEVIIKAENVSFFYGQFQALKNISLDIMADEVTAFIGPSGCGKSTFLKLLNRMHDFVPGTRLAGEILVRGTSLYGPETDPVDIRRRVGMVFQRPNPFPKSIYDNICYGPRLVGVTKKSDLDQVVEKALKAAALWDDVKDKLGKSALDLSGGQQQRVCIARALALEPEILLMDEPTSALDPIATSKVEDWIRGAGMSIVIVTHNMQQAARISDRTAFFYMGELIEFGPTLELFTSPREVRTENYITGRFG
ncbi:MAG: phosphate ABC transporter ATP-binding protein PstB [Deltaproteobacteria bacterium]|jgi:phosphate transport system ATP-binding protein|nr:phosphate ABC transporter ATP-binding protein PstB [Deltaproteobacteria bacterium]